MAKVINLTRKRLEVDYAVNPRTSRDIVSAKSIVTKSDKDLAESEANVFSTDVDINFNGVISRSLPLFNVEFETIVTSELFSVDFTKPFGVDPVGVADYNSKLLTKPFAEITTVFDNVDIEVTFDRYHYENVNTVEALFKDMSTYQSDYTIASDYQYVTLGKIFADTVSTTDAIQTIGVGKNYGDTVSTSDSLDTVVGFIREYFDTVSTQESLAKDFSKALELNSVIAADSTSLQFDALRTFLETVSSTEAIQTFAVGKNYGDTVNTLDSLNTVVGFIREYSDVATVSDLISLEPNKVFEDVSTAADAFSLVFDALRTFSETTTANDLIKSFDATKLTKDIAVASDSVSLFTSFLRTFSDTTTASDVLSKEFGGNYSEIVTVSETVSTVLTKLVQVYETLVVLDSYSKEVGKNLTELINTSEQLIISVEALKSDVVTVAETLSKDNSMGLITETVSSADEGTAHINDYAEEYFAGTYVGTTTTF